MIKADLAHAGRRDSREELSQLLKASVPGRNNPLWRIWWIAFLFWAATFGVSLYIGWLRLLYRKGHPPKQFLDTLFLNTPIIADVLILAMTYLLVTGFRRRPFLRTICWGSPRPDSPASEPAKRTWFGPIVVGVVAAAFVVVVTRLLLLIPGPKTEADKLLYSSPWSLYVISLTAVVVAAFVEEVLYRGVLFGAWERVMGAACASFFSVVFFAFVHLGQFTGAQGKLNFGEFLSVALLGVICTALRARTGRIVSSYVAHLGMNLYTGVTLSSGYDPLWVLLKRLTG